jgi:hypothetical protein
LAGYEILFLLTSGTTYWYTFLCKQFFDKGT